MQYPANPDFEWSSKYSAEEEEASNNSSENSEEFSYNNDYGEEEEEKEGEEVEEELDGELEMWNIEDEYEIEEEFTVLPDISEPTITDNLERKESISFTVLQDSYSRFFNQALIIPKHLVEDISVDSSTDLESKQHKPFVIEWDPSAVETEASSLVESMLEEKKPVSVILSAIDVTSKDSFLISRKDLILLCERLIASRKINKLKNVYLQRKMTNFFKRKKMEYVLHESVPNEEEQLKSYKNKLYLYEKSKKEFKSLQSKIEIEIELLTKTKDDKLSTLSTEFNNLQKLEYEHGSALRTAQRGNRLPGETIEKLLRRQREKMEELAKERLKYLKIRNKTTEIENKAKCLEKIGQGLTISNYEGILAENNTLTDKLEEYADYLERERDNCNTCVQILAHVRERVYATNVDISHNTTRLGILKENVKTLRRRLADKASARLLIFRKKNKIKHENCLLLNKDLFRDYCDTEQKIESNNLKLEFLKKEIDILHAQKVSLINKKETVKKEKTNVATS